MTLRLGATWHWECSGSRGHCERCANCAGSGALVRSNNYELVRYCAGINALVPLNNYERMRYCADAECSGSFEQL